MPKAPKSDVGRNKKVVHPQSRKASQMAKKAHHENHAKKRSLEKVTKLELLGNKLNWFKENLDAEKDEYTKEDISDFIERYLQRFDDELEQIEIINSIPGRQGRQHFSREQSIKSTLENERRDYETVGLEIPDILNRKSLKYFLEWNGEMRYMQNIKLRRFNADKLKNCTKKEDKTITDNADSETI